MSSTGLPLAVNPANLRSVLTGYGLRIDKIEPWGPVGVALSTYHRDRGNGSVIVTQAEQLDGVEWVHASIAWASQVPTYSDLAALHRAVFGRRRYAYQVFVPDTVHVNIHKFALHLWGRADGANVLPDFGWLGSI